MKQRATEPPVKVGDVLVDKYRVERVLGAGGMGVVVAATHIGLGELRAIKFLLPDYASSARAVERFMREARASARLKSEHAAKVHDVGRLPTGEPYMVMEHLEGCTLQDLQRQRGAPLPLDEATLYIVQALEAVAEAHASSIVHRDLKPANLFLTEDAGGLPRIKVLDFGISKVGADIASGDGDMTETSSMLGTPLYMSPEQMRSTKAVDPRTDVWSIGVILYKLLTGRNPFKGETITAVCADVVESDPLPPSQLNGCIPAALEAVILTCLEKDREHRYPNVAALADALAPFVGPDGDNSRRRIAGWLGVPSSAPSSSASFRALMPSDPSSAQGRYPLPSTPPQEPPGEGSTAASWGRTGASTLRMAPPRKRRAAIAVGIGVGVAAVALAFFVHQSGAAPDLAQDLAASAGAPTPSPAATLTAGNARAGAEADQTGQAQVASASASAQEPGPAAEDAGVAAKPPLTPRAAKAPPRPPRGKPVEPAATETAKPSKPADPFGDDRW